MSQLARKLAGKFIVVDGPDGAGKSTQIASLAAWLANQAVPLATTRDPGGTAIGDRIRRILLDPGAGEMSAACETMLYMASRAQLVAEVIRPALADGKCVLCDRFISATLAYQGAAGVNGDEILAVAEVAVGRTWPDLTIILDVDSQTGLSRIRGRPDRMEAKTLEFHFRVRQAFMHQAAEHPGRCVVVDATGQVDQVADRLRQALLTWRF